MSTPSSAERPDAFVAQFSPRVLDVIKALASERIYRAMDHGLEPAQSDLVTLEHDDDNSSIRYASLQDFGNLVTRLQDYVQDADRAATNIRMVLPPEAAEPMVRARMERADIAGQVATILHAELAFQQQIGPTIDFPEEWAS